MIWYVICATWCAALQEEEERLALEQEKQAREAAERERRLAEIAEQQRKREEEIERKMVGAGGHRQPGTGI